jgi:NAD-dependent dihydropyrimidine dehydrogenase PreA subunit
MFRIEINEETCIRCGRCVDACPIPCFMFDDEETQIKLVNQEGCLVCRNCEEECPMQCIQITSPYRSTVDYF